MNSRKQATTVTGSKTHFRLIDDLSDAARPHAARALLSSLATAFERRGYYEKVPKKRVLSLK